MSTFEELLDLYLAAAGRTEDAVRERFQHLNYAYRRVCAELEVPELFVPDAEVNTVASQDWVEVDCDVYNLEWIVLKNTGDKLTQEPMGMRGRARYYEDGQKRPPLGTPAHYVRRGSRIWLRDSPEEVLTLIVSFRMHPPTITSSNLSEHPITPTQYDMALAKLAAANYFTFHPFMLPDGTPIPSHATQLEESAQVDLRGQQDPAAAEHRDADFHLRQRGYDFTPWGR